jgi:hypothetical protein
MRRDFRNSVSGKITALIAIMKDELKVSDI